MLSKIIRIASCDKLALYNSQYSFDWLNLVISELKYFSTFFNYHDLIEIVQLAINNFIVCIRIKEKYSLDPVG